jgi:hypothetical protein
LYARAKAPRTAYNHMPWSCACKFQGGVAFYLSKRMKIKSYLTSRIFGSLQSDDLACPHPFAVMDILYVIARIRGYNYRANTAWTKKCTSEESFIYCKW